MIKRHRFDNGFQIVYQKSEQLNPVTSMNIFCGVGSAFEVDPIRGASHFVEHMCFKGTREHMKARNLLMEYNKVGAQFNAYTTKRYTAYTITCGDDHIKHCTDLLSDMLLFSEFPQKEFDKEQRVVVEENIRTKDNNEYMLEKSLDALYFHGNSYQYPIDIIDYHPSPTHLRREDIYQWYKWFYRPSNMIYSIVSNLPFNKIVNCIKTSRFMKKETNSIAPTFLYPTLTIEPINQHFIYYQKKGIAATILHVGFRTCNYHSKDKYIIQLLTHILNGFSGRLFTAFRTKRGLTYHSSAHTTYHEHTGYFNFFIQTDPAKLINDGKNIGIIPILIDMITNLIQDGITPLELEVAKGNCKGKMLIALQSIEKLVEYNGVNSIMQEDAVPFQHIYKKYIEPITVSQVNAIIRKYMTSNNLVVGIAYDKDIPKRKIEEMFTVI